jgi:hypothetical protein
MSIRNVVRVVAYSLRHPRSTYQSMCRLSLIDRAAEFAAEFHSPEVEPSAGMRSDPRYLGSENPLWEYFQSNREGPGIWKWMHYFEIYQRHLSKFVDRSPHIVEVGVYSGGSLRMWRDYFGPGCRISGIDIAEECTVYEDAYTSIYIGDQADREFWKRFRDEAPPVDVLIDDGGHLPEQQRVTLEEMLPFLPPGGVYLCEDVHGTCNAFAAYTHKLADLLNDANRMKLRESDDVLDSAAMPFQQMIHSIHFYPFAVVIERTDHPVDCFRAPKQGTEWQPFGSRWFA